MRRLDSLIDQVGADQVAHGEARQSPASDLELDHLRTGLKGEFGAALPEDYARVLRRANGLDHNGLVLYGATQSQIAPGPGGFWQGLAAVNRLWREVPGQDQILILGETDMDFLTVDLDGANPSLRDKVSGDVVDAFETVTALLEAVIGQRL